MILFSSRKLEVALSNNLLNDWQKVKYIIFMTVLGYLSGTVYWGTPLYGRSIPLFRLPFYLASAIISAYVAYRGIKKCFKTNEVIDAMSFFERIICLSVPVWLQLTIILLPLTLALSWLIVRIGNAVPELEEKLWLIFYVLSPATAFVYFHLLNNSFVRLGVLLKEAGTQQGTTSMASPTDSVSP